MNNLSLIKLAVFLTMIIFAFGCQSSSQPRSKVGDKLKEIGAFSAIGITKKGAPVLVDAKTGETAISCKKRENTNDPCKFKKLKKAGKLRILEKFQVYTFVGSCCVTYEYDGATYEKCRPTQHPHPNYCGAHQ